MSSHFQKDSHVWYCVAGGVAVGSLLGMAASLLLQGMNKTKSRRNVIVGNVWKHLKKGGAPGFTVRKTLPQHLDGVDVMLEKWEAGSSEPPHSHAGDDMTVVVKGKMSLQFYKKVSTEAGDELVKVGDRKFLEEGEVGYVAAGQIHDATYHTECHLVYVHDGKFEFTDESVDDDDFKDAQEAA
eukprot:g4495.t1